MPYISKNTRRYLDPLLEPLYRAVDSCEIGDLNYMVTKLAIRYVQSRGIRYASLNEAVGALDSAKAEFQRRMVSPYEDQKREQNGDVYNG